MQCTNDYDWNVYWASVPGLTTWTILQKMTLITSACGAPRTALPEHQMAVHACTFLFTGTSVLLRILILYNLKLYAVHIA